MPVSVATLRLLMDAGLEGDDLLRVVASIDADNPEKKRSSAAERQARYRERKRSSGVTGDVTSDVTQSITQASQPRAHVEDNLKPEISTGQEGKKGKSRRDDLSDFKAECSELDAERLAALIKHRKAKNGQITGHAARLFRRDAEACGLSLADAVDTCISRNWITVKAEWLEKRPLRQASQSPPRHETDLQRMTRLMEQETNGSRDEHDGGNVIDLTPVSSLSWQR